MPPEPNVKSLQLGKALAEILYQLAVTTRVYLGTRQGVSGYLGSIWAVSGQYLGTAVSGDSIWGHNTYSIWGHDTYTVSGDTILISRVLRRDISIVSPDSPEGSPP